LAEELATRVGSSVSDSRCSVNHFCLNAFPSLTKYVGVLLILFNHVFDMNPLLLNFCFARSRSLFGRNVVFCAQRFNCSINDLIFGHLPIIINSYIRNSVDKTTLDHVAFLRELIMIRDSSLTFTGLSTSDELNDVISHVCASFS